MVTGLFSHARALSFSLSLSLSLYVQVASPETLGKLMPELYDAMMKTKAPNDEILIPDHIAKEYWHLVRSLHTLLQPSHTPQPISPNLNLHARNPQPHMYPPPLSPRRAT